MGLLFRDINVLSAPKQQPQLHHCDDRAGRRAWGQPALADGSTTSATSTAATSRPSTTATERGPQPCPSLLTDGVPAFSPSFPAIPADRPRGEDSTPPRTGSCSRRTAATCSSARIRAATGSHPALIHADDRQSDGQPAPANGPGHSRRLRGSAGALPRGRADLGWPRRRRLPEVVEQRAQPVEPLGPGAVEPPRPLAALVQQAHGAQDGQVLADRGAGHVEGRRDVSRRRAPSGPRDGGSPAGAAAPALSTRRRVRGHRDNVSVWFRQQRRRLRVGEDSAVLMTPDSSNAHAYARMRIRRRLHDHGALTEWAERVID